MPLVIYSNAYASVASATVNPGDLTFSVSGGQGARFPLLAGQWTYGTLIKNATGALEVVKITARAVDVLTIVRNVEGTGALTFNSGDRIECRPCAAAMNDVMADGIDVTRKAVLAGTDTYTGTLSPAITGYSQYAHLLQFTNANTLTNPTINLNGLGAKTIKNRDGAAPAAGDIKAGSWHIAYYDGTNFLLLTLPTLDPTTLVQAGTVISVAQNTAPTGYLKANGAAVSRATYAALFAAIVTAGGFASANFTVTIATPGVFTKATHGFVGGERLRLSTSGALPTGLNTSTDYYVEVIDANTFYLTTISLDSTTRVNTSGSQSGTHSYLQSWWGLGDGSTTFNVPDLRGEFVRGWDDGRGVDTVHAVGAAQRDAFQGHWHELRADGTGAGSGGGYMGLQSGGSVLMAQAVKAPNTDGVNGTPRTAAETRPRNVALLACIKY